MTILFIVLQILSGLVFASIIEWLLHKYVLHELGKKDKNSTWRFHWSEHHRDSRKFDMIDESYLMPFWKNKARQREVLGLAGLAAINVPFLFFAPWFAITAMLYTVAYYFAHKKSHIDSKWGKKYLKHHVDHHLGKNQDQNWNVLLPIADYMFGTRVKY